MFKKLDSNKREMGESSSVLLKANKAGPRTEVVVDDPSWVTSSLTATPVVQAVVSPSLVVTPLPSSTGLSPLVASFNLARDHQRLTNSMEIICLQHIAAKGKEF